MNLKHELQAEWEYMKRLVKKIKHKTIKKERNTMPFDPTFEADLQAVADKNIAVVPNGFDVTVAPAPVPPVAETVHFTPVSTPPVV